MIRAIIAKFSLYIYIILIATITVLFIYCKILSSELDNITHQLQLQIEEISLLEKSSKLYASKVELASNRATHNIQKNRGDADLILLEDVSSNCEAAVKWGITQAIEL